MTRILTLILTTVLMLAMATGIASATITPAGSSEEIVPGQTLPTTTEVSSNAEGGMEITYIFSDEIDDMTTATASKDSPIALIPYDYNLDGYQITMWKVRSITPAASVGDQDRLTLEVYETAPIQYTLEYYDSDQTTLLQRDEDVTVENADQFVSPAPTKDGYVLSHWVPVSSGGTFSPGVSIDAFFLTTQGHPDYGYVIQFYAVWEEAPAEVTPTTPEAPAEVAPTTPETPAEVAPTTPETPAAPLDDSPKAGDDTPIHLILTLMAVVTAVASIARKRSNNPGN